MKDWTMIRERFLRDEPPVRLGGLAANLARSARSRMGGRERPRRGRRAGKTLVAGGAQDVGTCPGYLILST
jgi:hypothetical protein